jgi:cell division septation protein DedD
MLEQQQDTEIVLGTGKLLGIFFGLVIVCGVFFGLGFTLGRSSGPMTLQNSQSSTLTSGPGQKRAAGLNTPVAAATAPAAIPETTPAVNTTSDAQVEQTAKPDQTVAEKVDSSVGATQSSVQASDAPPPELASQPAPGAITVQVAAVTKQEDAQALVSALRRRNYPVFVASTVGGDNLYHVQVGPFGELKDAEAMRSKLVGDGYNAILKK